MPLMFDLYIVSYRIRMIYEESEEENGSSEPGEAITPSEEKPVPPSPEGSELSSPGTGEVSSFPASDNVSMYDGLMNNDSV